MKWEHLQGKNNKRVEALIRVLWDCVAVKFATAVRQRIAGVVIDWALYEAFQQRETEVGRAFTAQIAIGLSNGVNPTPSEHFWVTTLIFSNTFIMTYHT